MAQRKKIWFWLVLFLLFVIISAAFTEIVLRVLYREQDAIGSYFGAGAYVQDDLAGYRHTPGFQSEVYRRGAFVCRINIAQNGLRQSNFDAQRQYPKRVLLRGDSFTFGLGVAEEETFATRLQKALNLEGIGVINGGQTGYCVVQEASFEPNRQTSSDHFSAVPGQ